ncbi:D-galactoside/L-rhamnose binding SUEL lectin domain-containing protein [Artemisia annua]|uniref:D-galactoside/L-rhamnose binding SUEL lectin domain-containing protein n=1 Tax=Artemisia annua TaxID=35608 RepID=A0A2U1QKZ3_ARTAN|nr:D-galactoside/L-rhamnose binding SUEL lectin domain-containing protein [Artemisia annua]
MSCDLLMIAPYDMKVLTCISPSKPDYEATHALGIRYGPPIQPYSEAVPNPRLKTRSQHMGTWRTSTTMELHNILATFNAPMGDEPLALDMSGMWKSQERINGQSMRRYWTTYATESHPAQVANGTMGAY